MVAVGCEVAGAASHKQKRKSVSVVAKGKSWPSVICPGHLGAVPIAATDFRSLIIAQVSRV
jgi:hypothetical protein